MDFENGVIVNIYKSYINPILVGERLRRPQTKELWLWNFDNDPIFKFAILSMNKLFSPERRSKVVKFAKNDPLDTLIVIARDEQFFFPLKMIQRGDH